MLLLGSIAVCILTSVLFLGLSNAYIGWSHSFFYAYHFLRLALDSYDWVMRITLLRHCSFLAAWLTASFCTSSARNHTITSVSTHCSIMAAIIIYLLKILRYVHLLISTVRWVEHSRATSWLYIWSTRKRHWRSHCSRHLSQGVLIWDRSTS